MWWKCGDNFYFYFYFISIIETSTKLNTKKIYQLIINHKSDETFQDTIFNSKKKISIILIV
jgi:hypothetical protein